MKHSKWFGLYTAAATFLVVLLASACEKHFERDETPRQTITAEAMAEAKDIYEARCTACHGSAGNSDGPSAATLRPLPARFTEPSWQESITDWQIEAIIRKGGSEVGKSLLMPPNLDLSDQTIMALRVMVRDFGKATKR